MAISIPSALAPKTTAQSSGDTTDLSLTFHAYSLVLWDPNGSLYVYDGADGAQANQATTQVNLNSQISGSRDTFVGPVSYWSAVVMWGIQLPMDLHVRGSVNMHVYISSTAQLSGLLSGGGYAMGIVDVDENNNEVKKFLTEAPYTVGNNPFTSTLTLYSLNTDVDYTFRKGHFLCFIAGLGATTQGFTATVYFGSADRNSGVTFPVVDTAQAQTFTAGTETVTIESNSAIQNFQYSQTTKSLSFQAQGINYTTGTCNAAIPKTLMQAPFTVSQGTQAITVTTTETATGYQLTFSHSRSTDILQIVGEAPPTTSPTLTGSPSNTDSPTQTALTPTPTPPVPEFSVVALTTLAIVLIVLVVVSLVLKRNR